MDETLHWSDNLKWRVICWRAWSSKIIILLSTPACLTTFMPTLLLPLLHWVYDFSLSCSLKVLCGRCHHVQLACHCAVTGKCSSQQWRSGCSGVGAWGPGGCPCWVRCALSTNALIYTRIRVHQTSSYLRLVYSDVTPTCVPVDWWPFPQQVHKCPSQATSVHNLTDQALMIFLSALSVVDLGHVRPRKEAVPHCWMVTLR